MTTFVGFVLFLALAIWGRKLREDAFRALSLEQRAQVADKIPNYTSTEMIPFAGPLIGLVFILLFKLAWLKVGSAIFLVAIVLLVTVFHLRARHRFRELGLPAVFLSQYENSRIVSYSALGVPLTLFAWVLYF
jgi:hypothetical protein